MAHTFDIRFARSGGITALFHAAGNSFGWKGDGRISIDAQGVNVVLKRGLASLLARRRAHRISAENIKEVYREGEALRVDFSTGDQARASLPFWVRDPDTAARIVQLLPTTRTVEMEQSPGELRERAMPRRAPQMIWTAALMAVIAGGALFLRYLRPEPAAPVELSPASDATATIEAPVADAGNTAAPAVPLDSAEGPPVSTSSAATGSTPTAEPTRYTAPEEARKLAMLAEDPIDWTSPPPSSRRATAEAMAREARMARLGFEGEPDVDGFVPMELPEIHVPDVVIPIRQTTLAYSTAREMLAAFDAGAGKLIERYRDERQDFDERRLDARTFANHLDALEIRWRSLSDGMLGDRKYDDPAIGAMRGTLLIVAVQQRVFLGGYAAGLRTGDPDRIERAFRELALADDAMARARAYVN
jgi:hypothetical protein